MKRRYIFLIITAAAVFFGFAAAIKPFAEKTNAQPAAMKKIILDAGHGGRDNGASVGSAVESEITLNITLRLAEILRAFGYEVILTRENEDSTDGVEGFNKVLDIKNRVEIANKHPNAVFLSIHINTFPQERVRGAQFFYSKNEQSKEFAATLRQTVIDFLQKENDRPLTKVPGSVYLFKNISNISALAECGFLTNDAERKLLVADEYCQQLALTLSMGIMRFCEENNGEMKDVRG